MVYGNADNDQLEKAVRLLISLIVLLFDPLAVILLIASNVGFKNKNSLTKTKKHEILTLDDGIFEEKNIKDGEF